jgi:hypothetical protein
MPRIISVIVCAILLAPLFAGCNKQSVSKANAGSNAKTEIVASDVPAADAATQPNALPTKDASAKQVCESFSRLLKNGERTLAEQLLTRRALSVAIDAGLELEPMGSQGAKVQIGEAMYATDRAQVAQVPCDVIERDGSKQKITWLMRRGDEGWRVAGLIVESDKGPEFLSLENKADVASITGNVKPSDVRLVSATDDE